MKYKKITLNLVEECKSLRDLYNKLGYSQSPGGTTKESIKNKLINLGISNPVDYFKDKRNTSINKICPICQSNFIVRKSKEKQVTCSYACANTYFRSGNNNANYITGISSYRDKALDAYGKVCNRCGFNNIKALEVHHKDKNRNNNEIENLEVLCANCHRIEHY